MNFLGGGERHNSADYQSARHATQRSADHDNTSPGDLAFLVGRPGDVRSFIHKRIFGGIKGAIGGLGGLLTGNPLGILSGGIKGFLRGGETAVPQATACPPGFFPTPTGCVPRASPDLRFTGPLTSGFQQGPLPPSQFITPPAPRRGQNGTRVSREIGPMGEAVLGQFGAGTEPEVFDTMVRRCPRKSVLGADGVCYNRGDLRNSDRWWPRGRRPLLTGGDMRAISTASSAAKKLQRKQKQLESLGLLKRPAPRTRRALPAGHRAELRHAGSGHE